MKNYVLVGVGARSAMFTEAFQNGFRDTTKLLAICDSNEGRLRLAADRLNGANEKLKTFGPEQFDEMLGTLKPDCVVVTTMDSAHSDYICRSLEAGCDVITEKPMTIDADRCQQIVDTAKRTGKSVRVTFNYRYAPPRTQVKELLLSGVVGKILSVNFQWLLDVRHGADYYRRWHRHKENSGGLMVHKATHHFDAMNWWLSTRPMKVYAAGKRGFYNADQARRYGLEGHGERCRECAVTDRCSFYLDMSNIEDMKKLYLDNEQYDGYFRDRCVFGDDISIEDTMNLVVEYDSGAIMSYSLNTFMPWEGYRVEFNGTKGRLEHSCMESSYMSGDGSVQGQLKPEGTSIKVFPNFKEPYSVEIRQAEGGHGGGDEVMLADIFNGGDDPLMRSADYVEGAYSILTGIAANKSFETGLPVMVADLVKGLGEPRFPAMPGENEKIPYVPNVVQ